jgi:hypothetical protein
MKEEDQLFIWKVGGLVDLPEEQGIPVVGTLQQYAKAWLNTAQGAEATITETVLTWNDRDPVTYTVKIERGPMDERDLIPYTFTVSGFPPAVAYLDGRS